MNISFELLGLEKKIFFFLKFEKKKKKKFNKVLISY